MDRALTEKPVSQLAIAWTLKHCHHYHLVQVAIGPPHLQIEYLWGLVACNDVIKRPVKSRPLCYCSMFVFLLLYCNCYTQLHSPPPHIYTTTTCNHHHTVQVARVQVEYLRQWLKEKTPPAQVATGDDHYMCKWSICASCWKEKHYQRKLQQVLTTTCSSGVFAPVDGRKTPPAQGAKVRTSIRANWSGMQQQLMQRQPPYHRPNLDQHGCRWSA